MKTLKFVLALVIIFTLGAGGYVYLGIYNIGADAPHYPVTSGFLEVLRERSIAARAFRLAVPEDLKREARVRNGAGNYDAMCVHCHLRPGLDNTEIRKGLNPRPPNLSKHADNPGEQFWVIKHGIKMTGMPAWGKAGVDDDTIWDMVALLQKLPDLNEEQYQTLVEASERHNHKGAERPQHGGPDKETQPDHDDAHPEESREGQEEKPGDWAYETPPSETGDDGSKAPEASPEGSHHHDPQDTPE